MVVGCVDVGDFIAGGGNCVLFNPGVGFCNQLFCWLAILGDWVALYVATSREYWATDWWDRIKNRMEVEKINLNGHDFVAVCFISLFLRDFVV